MEKKLLLSFIVFLFIGMNSVSAQTNYYINNQTSGSRSFTVSYNSEIVYHINTGVSKPVKINFSVQNMGAWDEIYVKYNVNGANLYIADGYAFGEVNFSKIIITPLSHGTIVIGYRNLDGSSPDPTVNFNFSVEEYTNLEGLIGMGMNPMRGKRLSVSGDSYFEGNTHFNGRIGIGTASPAYPLDVNGVIQGTSLYARSSSYYMFMNVYSSYAQLSTNSPYFYMNKPLRVYQGQIGSYNKNNLQLQTNGTTIMTILNSNGFVGIGKTAPQYKLDVTGTVKADSLIGGVISGTNSSKTIKVQTNYGYIELGPTSTAHSLISTDRAYFYFNKPVRVSGGSIGSNSGNLYLQTGGTTRATILSSNGNVGIGVANPQNKLEVNGVIRAKQIIVETGWADFVFADNYRLPSLNEVKKHINENKHLPGIPTETEVLEKGVNLGDMQVKLLQKIEELTLYVIKQEENSEKQQLEIKRLHEKIEELENVIK